MHALGGTLSSAERGVVDGIDLRLIVWRTLDDAHVIGVPDNHCLERMVSSALSSADPTRAHRVQAFMDSGPEPAGEKEHAWAFMARWYADRGCENFYEAVWEDPALRVTLDPIADAIGLRAALDDP